ncbi:MAG: hypothetical protein V1860_00635, partial [bacterium]
MPLSNEQKIYLKNKIKGYTDEYLIKEITEKGCQYYSDAFTILKEELQNRGQNVNEELQNRGQNVNKILEEYKKSDKMRNLPLDWFNFYVYIRLPLSIGLVI